MRLSKSRDDIIKKSVFHSIFPDCYRFFYIQYQPLWSHFPSFPLKRKFQRSSRMIETSEIWSDQHRWFALATHLLGDINLFMANDKHNLEFLLFISSFVAYLLAFFVVSNFKWINVICSSVVNSFVSVCVCVLSSVYVYILWLRCLKTVWMNVCEQLKVHSMHKKNRETSTQRERQV